MHISKFAKECTFSEMGIGGTFPATEEFQTLLLEKVHPSQLLTARLSLPVYEVKYSYLTKRGNPRDGTKYFISQNHISDEAEYIDFTVEMAMDDFVSELKREKPYREISNVQILEINLLGFANLKIGY